MVHSENTEGKPLVDVFKSAGRRKRLEISPEFVIDWLKAGEHRFRLKESALPDDAKVVHSEFSLRTIILWIESEEWPIVKEGDLVPDICPVIQSLPLFEAGP